MATRAGAATKEPLRIRRARDKIPVSDLIARLADHALGTTEMTPSQVSAALGLLKKAVPDLSTTGAVRGSQRQKDDISDDELIAIARTGGANGPRKTARP
ncbi:MAG: hypothetical protein MPJ78_11475 [Hyphomicrobiaceae bacterium]|nr:hypothetical protein [Hyphomicrobiaceae bacterium]